MVALARIGGLAVLAWRLLARVAARPYAALTALSALAGLLIALGWFGLELRDASEARRAAERRLAAATTTMLNHDRARIDALSAQLRQAALTAAASRRPRQPRWLGDPKPPSASPPAVAAAGADPGDPRSQENPQL